ncbi:MAG: 2Fe-2S iron-sulfur cluster binding domain-containing protein [Bdellovibrionales bacterium]|nr:2Fe-2S iron-sulfur cluster binding domain-containing protein [Bdellovibrionales bacterium]
MKVKFLPQGIELEIQPNQTVMDLAHRNGIFIKSICNGVPNCAECRVKLVEGEYNVLPPSSKELSLIGSGHFIDQRRLSCQLYCFGDITVDLTEQEKKEHEGPPGSRRFQVDLRNEGVVSKAVTGNLIQQDDDIVQAITEDLNNPNSPAVGKVGKKGEPNLGNSKSRLEAMIKRTEDKSKNQSNSDRPSSNKRRRRRRR